MSRPLRSCCRRPDSSITQKNSNGWRRRRRSITGIRNISTRTKESAVMSSQKDESSHVTREESYSYNSSVLSYIHQAAERGLYDIRGLGAKRKLPTFDDLVLLTASLSRYPLEGYRQKRLTKTLL